MYEENDFENLAPWIVIVLILVGGWLRVMLLATKGLWLDETFSLWLTSHNIPEMLHLVARIDQEPPLYYLLLHIWISLNGNSIYAVRFLSALLGAATIPMVYLIGKRISGVVLGLVAAFIFMLSPFNIRYAQETRMYALLTFNAAVAIYALVRLVTDPRSTLPIGSQLREYIHTWRTLEPVEPDKEREFTYKAEPSSLTGVKGWIYRHRWLPIQSIETDIAWIVFIVFTAATMLSHNTAVLFPFTINIIVLGFMLLQRIKNQAPLPGVHVPSFWNWVKAQVVIFILWSPWLIALSRQVNSFLHGAGFPRPTWDMVLQTIQTLLNETMPGQGFQTVLIWILYAILIVLGLFYFRKNLAWIFFLALLIAIPILAELVLSIRRPIFLDRTLIWTSIPLFLLLAAGIVQLRFRLVMIVVLGILAINNIFSAGDYYRFAQKEDWSTPAGFVANFVQKDDLILFNATRAQIPFDYYFKTYEDLYSITAEKHGVPVDLFDSGELVPIMTEADISNLNSMLSGHKTVWLVYAQNLNSDPQGLIPQTLASKMKLTYTREFNGGQVQIYTVP